MRQGSRSSTRPVVTHSGDDASRCVRSHCGRPLQESRDVQLVPFLDSDNKRQRSASPSREENFPNKVLARQQAKLVRSLFQTGVRDGMTTFGAQGGERDLRKVAVPALGFGPWKGSNDDSGGLSGIIPFCGGYQ